LHFAILLTPHESTVSLSNSGASGSVAVVQVALKRDFGEEELYFAVILMGIYQMIVGVSGITKFAKVEWTHTPPLCVLFLFLVFRCLFAILPLH
jgi:purine-cytosine permease-like protein